MAPDREPGQTGGPAAAVAAHPAFEETRLLAGRVHCFQPVKGYRSAIDAILLPAAVPAASGQRVLELGCGTGAAALCLAARVADVRVVGLDIQQSLIFWAARGAAASGVEGRVRFVAGDLLAPPAAVVEAAPFDHVMANPPYLKAGSARPPQDPGKALATIEGAATLRHWLDAAWRMVKPGGSITVIHRGDRLGDLLAAVTVADGGTAMKIAGDGPAILPFLPHSGAAAASRVIVQARRGGTGAAATLVPVVLHRAGGGYTVEADQVLQGGSLAARFQK